MTIASNEEYRAMHARVADCARTVRAVQNALPDSAARDRAQRVADAAEMLATELAYLANGREMPMQPEPRADFPTLLGEIIAIQQKLDQYDGTAERVMAACMLSPAARAEEELRRRSARVVRRMLGGSHGEN